MVRPGISHLSCHFWRSDSGETWEPPPTLWPYDQTCSVLSGRWLQQNLLRTCRKITPWRSSSQSWAVKKQFFCWKKLKEIETVWKHQPVASDHLLPTWYSMPYTQGLGWERRRQGQLPQPSAWLGDHSMGDFPAMLWLPEGFEPVSVLKLLLSPFRASVPCGWMCWHSTPSHRCRA